MFTRIEFSKSYTYNQEKQNEIDFFKVTNKISICHFILLIQNKTDLATLVFSINLCIQFITDLNKMGKNQQLRKFCQKKLKGIQYGFLLLYL